jgi:hypothetical protein
MGNYPREDVKSMAGSSQFIDMEDAAGRLGVKRSSLYYYIRTLKLETHKFPLDKHVYLSLADFERVKALKDQAAERQQKRPGESSEEAA